MQSRQNHIIFYSTALLLVSLFVSRAALSVSAAIFTLACFIHPAAKEAWRNWRSSPLLWGMSLLFVLPLLSGAWSDDRQEWINVLRVKLPLLILPFAFAVPFSFTSRQWGQLAAIFIILIGAGTFWTMFHYLGDMQSVNENYLRAGTMATPLGNDHVRFSWLVNLAFLLSLFLGWSRWKERWGVVWLVVAIWLLTFLHILAARTGLLCLYISLAGLLIFFASQKRNWKYVPALLVAVIVLPLIAWFALPTFRNKLRFFRYDFDYFKEANYLPGANDATRAISFKAGWHLMREHPAAGTGFGDVFAKTRQWYETHYPQMQAKEKILPSNEWLIYGAACGIPGLLAFTCVMLIPFFIRVRYRWTWRLLNVLVAVSFSYDIGLEVQYGIFIYCLAVLLSWKYLHSPVADDNK